jgi:hypothetical protein
MPRLQRLSKIEMSGGSHGDSQLIRAALILAGIGHAAGRCAWTAALIFVFVFWLIGAHPAVAFHAKFWLEAKARFASLCVFVRISNPADAVTDNSSACASGCIGRLPFRSDFGPQFLAAQYFRESFDYRALDIDSKVWAHKNLSPHLNILCYGFTRVEGQYRGANERMVFVDLTSRDLDSMDNDLRAMGGNELGAREFKLAFASKIEADSSKTESGGCYSEDCGKDRQPFVVFGNSLFRTFLYGIVVSAFVFGFGCFLIYRRVGSI